MLLGEQEQIRPATPMPVSDTDASIVLPVTGETATFYYNLAGVLTLATGEASGTVIYAKLAYDGILNALSSTIGTVNDTSFAFGTGTVLTTKTGAPGELAVSNFYALTLTQKFAFISANLTSGQYFIDHINGAIWGVAAALVATDTCSYKVKTSSISATITTGDIEIGAVELKDATSDTRVVVKTDGTNNALVVTDNTAKGAGDSSSTTQRVVIASDQVAIAVNTELPAGAVLADATLNPATPSLGAFVQGFNGTTWDRLRAGITGVITSITGYLNVMNVGRYNATALTLADTNYVNAQVDVNGNQQVNQRTLQAGEDLSNNVMATSGRKLASPTYSPLLFTNFGANATLNVKASAGNVFSVSAYNTNAAARFIQIHNTATVPGGAAVPLIAHLVPAGAEVILGEDFFSTAGLNFTTGIAFAMSTTLATYTAATAGEGFVEVHYL